MLSKTSPSLYLLLCARGSEIRLGLHSEEDLFLVAEVQSADVRLRQLAVCDLFVSVGLVEIIELLAFLYGRLRLQVLDHVHGVVRFAELFPTE